MTARVLPVGPRTLLVELADQSATLALLDALSVDPVPGVEQIVPGARTLMIRTVPGVSADATLAHAILARRPVGVRPDTIPAETIEIAMRYDGADLDDIARHMCLSVPEVLAAHQEAVWQVAFCGFAPGFAYMTCGDPRFDLPRRTVPRTRIPAGSVALAGRFCGIYPNETPGGWQLLGRTDLPMFDLGRNPPALLRPGIRARFVKGQAPLYRSATLPPLEGHAVLSVVSTVFPILFQDEGRRGQAGMGVSPSGAMDIGALRRANRAVGNPSGAAALEITSGPVRLRAEAPVTLALSGAGHVIVGAHRIVTGTAFALDTGDEMTIAPHTSGLRSYLALRGGYGVRPVLGSAATDTLAFIGPEAVSAGTVVIAGNLRAEATCPQIQPDLPGPGALIELPVTLGPRTAWFTPDMVHRFLSQDWLVTPQSSRVGLRLEGQPVSRDATELPSEGTETGALQIPHSGQPILFLADHPLTGGYPVIATLLPQALDLAGQIPPGARIRFTANTAFAEIIP